MMLRKCKHATNHFSTFQTSCNVASTMSAPCWCFLLTALLMIKEIYSVDPWIFRLPEIEREHDWERFQDPPARMTGNTKMPEDYQSPDFRLKEDPWKAYDASYRYVEENRPLRISPHFKQIKKWKRVHKWFVESENIEFPDNLGCYCTTVYRRLRVLAGCAVLTPRHILTTATSTELVIRNRHNDKTLENILGFWYDTKLDRFNSSMYGTPSRIHYHPRYIRPNMVNASHPLPNVYDLSIWATTFPLHYAAKYCVRANSGWYGAQYGTTSPIWPEMTIIVGFQYIKALRKKPLPWFKYAVRTRNWILPCPKSGWGWFHCITGSPWATYGVESGAAWHRSTRRGHMLDGLAGMCSFSLKLRSEELIHYFTVINTHRVLDFIYDAYMGRLAYEYLDQRFNNNQWRAPRPKTYYYVKWDYAYGVELYYDEKTLPFY